MSDDIFFKPQTTIEILSERGNKRLIKRIFSRTGNKLPEINYCIQERLDMKEERWSIKYYNKSRILVERKFLGL